MLPIEIATHRIIFPTKNYEPKNYGNYQKNYSNCSEYQNK